MTTPRDQMYFDLFITALEGGINYWAEIAEYHWMLPPPEGDLFGPEDHDGFYAVVWETDEFDEIEHKHRIDRAVMARGYGLAAGDWRQKIRWSSGEAPPLFIDDDTDWDFDARDADTIVQLGLGLIDTIGAGDRAGQKCVRYG